MLMTIISAQTSGFQSWISGRHCNNDNCYSIPVNIKEYPTILLMLYKNN